MSANNNNSQQEEHGDTDGLNSSLQNKKPAQLTTCYPVFNLTKAPREYFNEFDKHARASSIPWTLITSNDPHMVRKEIEANSLGNSSEERPSVIPFFFFFFNSSVDSAYAFYKSLRTQYSASLSHFTNFTFLAIDETCVQSSPKHCLLCSDAPDYAEAPDEVKLKVLHSPIEKIMPCLHALEHLAVTPSEVENNPRGVVQNVLPHPFLMPVGNERAPVAFPIHVRAATPAEARLNRRKAMPMGLEFDDRATTVVEVPLEECLYVAWMHRWALELFKRGGTGWIEGDTGAILEGEGEVRKGDTGAILEGEGEVRKGDMGVFMSWEEQKIEMYFGDSAPYHAGHVEMRMDFYPERSGGGRRKERVSRRNRES